ncbi:MAG: hypothetical protein AB7P40_31805 [Chloroflexota bacterium]
MDKVAAVSGVAGLLPGGEIVVEDQAESEAQQVVRMVVGQQVSERPSRLT